ncbi:MAG: MarR family transcriptional regulator [Rhodomicrobiaceae bacterium]
MSTRKTKPASKVLEKRASAKKSPGGQKKSAPPAFEGSVTHLIHRAEQCAGDIFARIASSGLITPRQFAILEAIEEDPGISQTGLVDKTGIDRSTLADIVRRMLDKGLVQRERTAEDARAYAVKLTRKGANTLQKMRPHAAEADKQMLAAISREHRDLFLSVLSQMVKTLSKRAESAK